MEAVTDYRLRIWHLFGISGCYNDLNVFDASPLQNLICECKYSFLVEFTVVGVKLKNP